MNLTPIEIHPVSYQLSNRGLLPPIGRGEVHFVREAPLKAALGGGVTRFWDTVVTNPIGPAHRSCVLKCHSRC